jgi:hypothetical protein
MASSYAKVALKSFCNVVKVRKQTDLHLLNIGGSSDETHQSRLFAISLLFREVGDRFSSRHLCLPTTLVCFGLPQ